MPWAAQLACAASPSMQDRLQERVQHHLEMDMSICQLAVYL